MFSPFIFYSDFMILAVIAIISYDSWRWYKIVVRCWNGGIWKTVEEVVLKICKIKMFNHFSRAKNTTNKLVY